MEKIIRLIDDRGLFDLSRSELDKLKTETTIGDSDGTIYPRSLYRADSALVMMVRVPEAAVRVPSVAGPAGASGATQRRLLVVSRDQVKLGFTGDTRKVGAYHVQEVLPTPFNTGPLWEAFPWTKPISLRDRLTTVGMGDRNGLATPGHIRCAREFKVSPVLAQQSIRELAFTGRSFADVVTDAAFHVFAEGFEDGYGADGDHLKTIPDIDRALAWGMPMVTLDLTDVMHPEVADWTADQVTAAFNRLPSEVRSRVEKDYSAGTIPVGGSSVFFEEGLGERCAVMYGDALDHATAVNQHLDRITGGSYDLEISIDETTTPTLPSHHLFIARELERRGVSVSSLAPRFIGEFQKAVDYIGDPDEFTDQFVVHAEIAKACGGYKISIHSGSDKFTVYPTIGRETGLRLHLKTAGTSWLESLRSISATDPALYRLMHQRAFDYFPEATKSYHIGADISAIRSLEETADSELGSYLEDDNCRQLLHISYGGLLRDPEVRGRYFLSLHQHEEAHISAVASHMRKHLDLLGLDRM